VLGTREFAEENLDDPLLAPDHYTASHASSTSTISDISQSLLVTLELGKWLWSGRHGTIAPTLAGEDCVSGFFKDGEKPLWQ
jgi:hypothetical protein